MNTSRKLKLKIFLKEIQRIIYLGTHRLEDPVLIKIKKLLTIFSRKISNKHTQIQLEKVGEVYRYQYLHSIEPKINSLYLHKECFYFLHPNSLLILQELVHKVRIYVQK